MNASVILAIVAILLAAVIVTAVVLTNRLSAYKADWNFFLENREKNGVKAAKILNDLVVEHKGWLEYLAARAEKNEKGKEDLEILTLLVQLALDQLDDGHEQKVVIVLQSTIRVLEQKLGVTAPYVPMKLD